MCVRLSKIIEIIQMRFNFYTFYSGLKHPQYKRDLHAYVFHSGSLIYRIEISMISTARKQKVHDWGCSPSTLAGTFCLRKAYPIV